MGRCEDCREWEDGECILVDCLDEDEIVCGANFAAYVTAADDHGLRYGLKTGPDFGCVRFRLRASEEK